MIIEINKRQFTLIDNDYKRSLIKDIDVKVVHNQNLVEVTLKVQYKVKHEMIAAKSYEVKHLNVEDIGFIISEFLPKTSI